MPDTPILPCHDHPLITSSPGLSSHRLQSPTYTIPPSILPHIKAAVSDLQAGRTVAFPTETVYGLGAHSLDVEAVKRIYAIKNRPADNPLIIHVSSLDMLDRLLPPTYSMSPLYKALIDEFWPGPLTLLFPNPHPPPPPAPSTLAIRMPAHPLALALIANADLPVSAPSANSSGRPSPTTAQHVFHDLNGKEGLGCILDGGPCGVGVESTVVNGLGWKEGGGGMVDVLRPGGLDVEAIAKIVVQVDEEEGRTEVLVHGKPWRLALSSSFAARTPPRDLLDKRGRREVESGPSTPGMKYRHYSPRVPVYLCLPSNTFPRPRDTSTESETSAQGLLRNLVTSFPSSGMGKLRVGLLHYDNSPLSASLRDTAEKSGDVDLVEVSLGLDATSAAQRLFAGMLHLEGTQRSSYWIEDLEKGKVHGVGPDNGQGGVDVLLIEGCTDDGLGLAVMERIRKAVGGGGKVGGLEHGQVKAAGMGSGTFWIDL